MRKPSGKYKVYNRIHCSAGSNHRGGWQPGIQVVVDDLADGVVREAVTAV